MEETDFDLVNGPVGGCSRDSRRLLEQHATHLVSTGQFRQSTGQQNFLGFRVATVPEPSAAILLAIASLALLWRRLSA